MKNIQKPIGWLNRTEADAFPQPIIGHKHYFMTKTRTTVEVYKFNEHI